MRQAFALHRRLWMAVNVSFLMLAFWSQSGLAAHPQHVSFAEVEWNPGTGNFEIALCVWALDLEHVVGPQALSDSDLPGPAKATQWNEQKIQSYLEQCFTIQSSGKGSPGSETEPTRKTESVIRWVGLENDRQRIWLYFEIKGSKTIQHWEVENHIFFDLNDDQLNQVRVIHGEQSHDIVLNQSKPQAMFSLEVLTNREPTESPHP